MGEDSSACSTLICGLIQAFLLATPFDLDTSLTVMAVERERGEGGCGMLLATRQSPFIIVALLDMVEWAWQLQLLLFTVHIPTSVCSSIVT